MSESIASKPKPPARVIVTLECEGCRYLWNLSLEPGKVAGVHRCARCLETKARPVERMGKRKS
jgi:hypothetical protein